jgi:hypothetical protein
MPHRMSCVVQAKDAQRQCCMPAVPQDGMLAGCMQVCALQQQVATQTAQHQKHPTALLQLSTPCTVQGDGAMFTSKEHT